MFISSICILWCGMNTSQGFAAPYGTQRCTYCTSEHLEKMVNYPPQSPGSLFCTSVHVPSSSCFRPPSSCLGTEATALVILRYQGGHRV